MQVQKSHDIQVEKQKPVIFRTKQSSYFGILRILETWTYRLWSEYCNQYIYIASEKAIDLIYCNTVHLIVINYKPLFILLAWLLCFRLLLQINLKNLNVQNLNAKFPPHFSLVFRIRFNRVHEWDHCLHSNRHCSL